MNFMQTYLFYLIDKMVLVVSIQNDTDFDRHFSQNGEIWAQNVHSLIRLSLVLARPVQTCPLAVQESRTRPVAVQESRTCPTADQKDKSLSAGQALTVFLRNYRLSFLNEPLDHHLIKSNV